VKILISNSAFSDFEDIKNYYQDEGVPEIGLKIVASIIEHLQTLTKNPDIGRVVPEFGETKIKELIHPPFRIVYLREQHSIHIVRIWRSERLLELPEE
jgi:plasmid stabilization system protein ParE